VREFWSDLADTANADSNFDPDPAQLLSSVNVESNTATAVWTPVTFARLRQPWPLSISTLSSRTGLASEPFLWIGNAQSFLILKVWAALMVA
jgi:hypothetical protein